MNLIELPKISYELVGTDVSSNLSDYKNAASELVKQAQIEPETDQDFADAELQIKAIDSGKKKLQAIKAAFLSETGQISDFIDSVDEIISSFGAASLARKKQVKAKKDSTKTAIISDSSAIARNIINEANKTLCGNYIVPSFDFETALKGKRTIESLVKAANDELNSF